MKPLPRSFYLQHTTKVARQLLGKVLVRRVGKNLFPSVIVETEAYLGFEDPACHSFHQKKTDRVKSLYLDGGHAYVYFIYGMYFCVNVVTGGTERPEAVLIRAVEPLPESFKFVKALRPVKREIDMTNGPGKLCLGLDIDKKLDGTDLTDNRSPLFICDGASISQKQMIADTRIGIESKKEAATWPLRFYIKNNIWVSRPHV